MKVMLNVHGFPPEQIGGAEWRAYRTALWLKRRGHSVKVVAIDDMHNPRPGLTVRDEQVDGIDVTRLSFEISSVDGWPYKNTLVFDYLRSRLRHDPPDVFHLISGARNTGSAIQAARQADVPVVVSLTEFYWLCPRNTLLRNTGDLCDCPEGVLECVLCFYNKRINKRLLYSQINSLTKGLYGRILLWLSKFSSMQKITGIPDKVEFMRQWRHFLKTTLIHANRLIAPSRFLRSIYINSGTPEDLFVLSRQGVDPSLWEQTSTSSHNGCLRFGYIGNILPHKGVDILIRAFTNLEFPLQSLRLNIFGKLDKNSVYGKKLQQLSCKDKRIQFLGSFDYSQVANAFSEIDVLVVPSVWYENSPNVILEAYACKTPVIASDIGGMAELVGRNTCGDLFPVGDIEGLSNTLYRLVQQPSIIDQWREGIPQVKLMEEEMSELEDIYRSVVSGFSHQKSIGY